MFSRINISKNKLKSPLLRANMFFMPANRRPIIHTNPVIYDKEEVEVPFEGDACLQGHGTIFSKGFQGCIALGGYFELQDKTPYSLLTHRAYNDSENNLERFNRLFNKIKEQGRISYGHIFIFHRHFTESKNAVFIRNPYETHFSASYYSLVNKLSYFLAQDYPYSVSLVPYSCKPTHSQDENGDVFINNKDKQYGTNLTSGFIEAKFKEEHSHAQNKL